MPSTKISDYDFDSAYLRLLEVYGVKNQENLAKRLGIKPSSVYGARKNGRIPAAWLLKAFNSLRINPKWVLYGRRHHKYVKEVDEL